MALKYIEKEREKKRQQRASGIRKRRKTPLARCVRGDDVDVKGPRDLTLRMLIGPALCLKLRMYMCSSQAVHVLCNFRFPIVFYYSRRNGSRGAAKKAKVFLRPFVRGGAYYNVRERTGHSSIMDIKWFWFYIYHGIRAYIHTVVFTYAGSCNACVQWYIIDYFLSYKDLFLLILTYGWVVRGKSV